MLHRIYWCLNIRFGTIFTLCFLVIWKQEQFSFWIKCPIAFTGAVNCADSWSGFCLTLLSGLKISGCTFTASLIAATPLAAGEVEEMMAYATPGLDVAVETLGTGRGGGVISLWPLDILSGLKGRSPWLLGLSTAVPRARLSGWLDCCSWHGLWGRLSRIRVFGLTCIQQGLKCYSLSSLKFSYVYQSYQANLFTLSGQQRRRQRECITRMMYRHRSATRYYKQRF